MTATTEVVVTGRDGSRAIVLRDPHGVEVASWPLQRFAPPDLGSVDVLARLQLVAQRYGWSVAVRNPCADLCALVELAGLADVLRLEVVGEPEGGEELGVEEVVEPGDPLT